MTSAKLRGHEENLVVTKKNELGVTKSRESAQFKNKIVEKLWQKKQQKKKKNNKHKKMQNGSSNYDDGDDSK